MFKPSTYQAFIEASNYARESQYKYGYLGRNNGDNTYTFEVTGKPGYVYVRIWQGEEMTLSEAINFGATYDPLLLVRLIPVNGKLVVEMPDPGQAVQLYGALAPGTALPPRQLLPGQEFNDYVSGLRFMPGLVHPSTQGGLYVTVEASFYNRESLSKQDFLMTPPGTASTKAWCAVSVGPGNALRQTTGTARPLAYVMTPADIAADCPVPYGDIPLVAIVLANGQTSISYADNFADMRQFTTPLHGRLSAQPTVISFPEVLDANYQALWYGDVQIDDDLTIEGEMIIEDWS